jgi:hypothetical protein
MGVGLLGSAPALAAARPSGGKESRSLFFEPRFYGASADGKSLDTRAINAAIDVCHQAGGGIVYLRPGIYLSGTVILKSNVTLYVEAGATILGSKNIADYPPQNGPNPMADAGQHHFIFARDAENVSLLGPGCIDGQGPSYWTPNDHKPKQEDLWREAVTWKWTANTARPSPMIELVGCRNIHMEGLRIQNSAGWTARIINCTNVQIQGVAVKNPIHGVNADGFDICNSQNVTIANCIIETADDVICLKSENPYGDTIPTTRNIVITNCVMSSCCNGLKIGTATHGGFENITFSNSVIYNNNVNLNERIIAGIALEMVDGGWVDGVTVTGIRMQRARTPIFIRRGIRNASPDGTPGYIRGILISDIHATGSILTSSVMGLPGFPVEDVTLSNIRIDSDEGGSPQNRVLPEQEKSYPEINIFGRYPSFGLYARHARGLRLRDVVLGAVPKESRPALAFEDVAQLDIAGLRTADITTRSAVELNQCRDVWIQNARSPVGAESFVEVSGSESQNILVSNCDLRATRQPVTISQHAAKSAVELTGNALAAE